MTNKKLHIILDPGHGYNGIGTSGKYSPVLDGSEFDLNHPYVYERRYREGNSNREIVKRLTQKLQNLGYIVHNTNLEEANMSLSTRVNRANKWCKEYGTQNCLFISVHSNAAGSGGWYNATGISVYVAGNASTKSKYLAQSFYDIAVENGYKGNRSTPKNHYWVANFYVIKNTVCPCMLTENLFYDNKDDLHRIMSEEGTNDIVDFHVKAIEKYYYKYFEL